MGRTSLVLISFSMTVLGPGDMVRILEIDAGEPAVALFAAW